MTSSTHNGLIGVDVPPSAVYLPDRGVWLASILEKLMIYADDEHGFFLGRQMGLWVAAATNGKRARVIELPHRLPWGNVVIPYDVAQELAGDGEIAWVEMSRGLLRVRADIWRFDRSRARFYFRKGRYPNVVRMMRSWASFSPEFTLWLYAERIEDGMSELVAAGAKHIAFVADGTKLYLEGFVGCRKVAETWFGLGRLYGIHRVEFETDVVWPVVRQLAKEEGMSEVKWSFFGNGAPVLINDCIMVSTRRI